MSQHPRARFAKQTQPPLGMTSQLDPVPDHGEQSYKGSGRLAGRKAIITGGDSGIGRAVAFAREGAELAIAVANFGKQVPMKRPGQPAELATAYVMLADPLSSYVSGATIAATGGKPII
jgi:NAD(P)-dependent dehydrogenase (short-subunit alcohol dehydrogenase family)